MPTLGIRVYSSGGLVTTNETSGLSVERSTSNVGFGPFKVDEEKSITSATTLVAGDAGVSTISGAAVLTQSMPTAASATGAEFIFRASSAHAHVLTGSQESNGTRAFISQLSGAAGHGSKLVMSGTVGSSVILKCDGLRFHVLSYSGSFSISGT
jgi:hypothetical protein